MMKRPPFLMSSLALAAILALTACSVQAPDASSAEASSSGSSGSASSAGFAAAPDSSSASHAMQPGSEGVVAIGLDYSAGTGYEWQCSVEPEGVLEQLGKETEGLSSDGRVSGGPLRDRFSFRAVSPGEATITFDLVRSWENEPAETQVYAFTVTDDLEMVLNPYKSSFENEPEWI